MLQETHSAPKDEATWQSKWGDKVWFSHGNTNSKGVAIAIQGSFGFKKIDTHSDTEGRYLILDAEINNIRTLIVNIYAPNEDHVIFFEEVTDKIRDLKCDNIIWGGDITIWYST